MTSVSNLAPAQIDILAGVVPGLKGALRSDHAGETGAVSIYSGILAVSRDAGVRALAVSHLDTEKRHLALVELMLPPRERSVLLWVWRIAGWFTGCLPALVGPRAVYATIQAVETFVVRHYEEQLIELDQRGIAGALRETLAACQADEARHRDEAGGLLGDAPGFTLRVWMRLVEWGSAAAVMAARRI